MSLPSHQENNDEDEDSDNSIVGFENEESAPVDFQVVVSDSSEDDQFDELSASPASGSVYVDVDNVRCPLCKRKRSLTCKDCLLRGNFSRICNKSHSSTTTRVKGLSRYSELKLKFHETQCKRIKLVAECARFTEGKEKIAVIVEEIEKYKNTIEIQKELKRTLESKITNANRDAEALKKMAEDKLKLWPTFRSRLDNMQSLYGRNANKLKIIHSDVQRRQDNLKCGTKSRIVQLRDHVFPIQEVDSQSRSVVLQGEFGFGSNSGTVESFSDEEDDTVRSLMTAKSNYWSRPDELVSSFGSCFAVASSFGPTLPASGDYSAYNMWTDRNPGGISSGSPIRNPAHCISAALTYTTQFVNLIAYYLDLRLPHRLSYSEFTNGDLVGGKFNRKVAKLNANVIHLCASQGIAPQCLQPRKTLPNLLLLFDVDQSDLGRRGPFEVASQLAKSMEDSIEKDLVIYEEGSSESEADWSESTFPSDWETINRGTISEEFGLQEMTNDQSYLQSLSTSPSYASDSMYGSRNQANMAGTGLLSSFTSFFKGWNK